MVAAGRQRAHRQGGTVGICGCACVYRGAGVDGEDSSRRRVIISFLMGSKAKQSRRPPGAGGGSHIPSSCGTAWRVSFGTPVLGALLPDVTSRPLMSTTCTDSENSSSTGTLSPALATWQPC